jgi:hypothetical protein
METIGQTPLRYSIGDNNNNNEEENDGEITQGDRLNEIKARRMQNHHSISPPSWMPSNTNVTSSLTFNPSAAYKRAHTPLNSADSMPPPNISSTMSPSVGIRRNYGPMPNTSSSVILNSNTRKPRSYISSATSLMKTPMYPSGRYISSTTNNIGATLAVSDSDNRDIISSAILKASNQQHRGKSQMTNTNPLPTHSYYTRSKSSYSKY